MGKPQLKSEIETLRSDAGKIIEDIQSLSKSVKTTGLNKSSQIASDVAARAEHDLQDIRERLKQVEEKSLEYAKHIDGHVKQNPYLYIIGSLGLGALLGKLLGSRTR